MTRWAEIIKSLLAEFILEDRLLSSDYWIG